MITLLNFEKFHKYYVTRTLARINSKKLLEDPNYANRIFFYYWAFERAGAPKAFKIAAVKTISDYNISGGSCKSIFRRYLDKKNLNVKNNPFLDPSIKKFDASAIIINIKDGKLKEAFENLSMPGINHKIKTFFIRDIIYLLEIEKDICTNCEDLLYTFPVDIWVEKTLPYLRQNSKPLSATLRKNYGNLTRINFELASATIKDCLQARISPLRLNMGIWYFASQFVGNVRRLEVVLKNGDKAVNAEALPFADLS